MEANDIKVDDEELAKIGELADDKGQITMAKFLQYLKSSDHWSKELATRYKVGYMTNKVKITYQNLLSIILTLIIDFKTRHCNDLGLSL